MMDLGGGMALTIGLDDRCSNWFQHLGVHCEDSDSFLVVSLDESSGENQDVGIGRLVTCCLGLKKTCSVNYDAWCSRMIENGL